MPVCYMLQMYEFNFVFCFIARKILQGIPPQAPYRIHRQRPPVPHLGIKMQCLL